MAQAQDRVSIDATMQALGSAARAASASLGRASAEQRNSALLAAAGELRERAEDIVAANAIDVQEAQARGLSGAIG